MKISKGICNGNACLLCRLCIRDWQPSIEASKAMLQYRKGETIFAQGEPVTGIYFVNSGLVKVHKQWGDKDLIVRFAKGGDVLGHRGLGKDMHYPIAATAMEPTVICFITLDFFWTTIRVNNTFTERLLMFYAEELQESERNMHNLAHMQVKGRIAYSLLLLKDKFGMQEDGALGIELSKQDFSSYVGAAYETVFRVLNELAEEETLEVSGRRIFMKNVPRLVAYATGWS